MRARQMQTVLPASELKSAGDGWPFVPVNPPPSEATTFESVLDRVSAGRAATDLYTQALAAVPLRTPVAGETDMTSALRNPNASDLNVSQCIPGSICEATLASWCKQRPPAR
jgi:hypothetical protein